MRTKDMYTHKIELFIEDIKRGKSQVCTSTLRIEYTKIVHLPLASCLENP